MYCLARRMKIKIAILDIGEHIRTKTPFLVSIIYKSITLLNLQRKYVGNYFMPRGSFIVGVEALLL